MTQDYIIRMAREAGFDDCLWRIEVDGKDEFMPEDVAVLERFAALVAANMPRDMRDYDKAFAEGAIYGAKVERAACAKVCDEWNWSSKHGSNPSGQLAVLAAAIRARTT